MGHTHIVDLHSLTSNNLGSGQLAIIVPGDILVVVTLELHLIPLRVWGLEVDSDLGALNSIDGPQGLGFKEMEVEALTSLGSEGLEGLLRVDCQGDSFAVNQLLIKGAGCEYSGGQDSEGMVLPWCQTSKHLPAQFEYHCKNLSV